MNWEIGIEVYTLMCIKWMTNRNLQYKKNKLKKKNIYGNVNISNTQKNIIHNVRHPLKDHQA